MSRDGISGGGDRSELRPLRPDGQVSHDLAGQHVVGNHKGQFSGFNIIEPAPGTVHQFGTRSDVLSARQRGWWVARPEDGRPASEMMELYTADRSSGVDTAGSPFGEYVHLVTSEENYRRLMEERELENRRQLEPAGMGFFDNVGADEFDTGRTGRGHVVTRFATRDHGTSLVQGDKVIEHISPQGILREEDL